VDEPYRRGVAAVLELEVDLGGSHGRTRYRLDGDELRAESIGKSSPQRRIALASVIHVQLAAFGGVTICSMRGRDGTKLALSSGMPGAPGAGAAATAAQRAFGTMLEALHERIAAVSPDAVFVTGSWALGGAMVVVALICAGLLASPYPSSHGTLRFYVGCVIVALSAFVVAPLALVRGRPKRYDPRKLPRAYDPVPDRA
jgi:hypothetical protein